MQQEVEQQRRAFVRLQARPETGEHLRKVQDYRVGAVGINTALAEIKFLFKRKIKIIFKHTVLS